MADKNELVALKTVKTFNDLALRAEGKGSETLTLMWKAGEVARKAKENIPHGGWMDFVKTHYVVTHSTVTRWMQFNENTPESKLCTVHNLTAGIKMLDPPKKDTSHTPPPDSDSEVDDETPPADDVPFEDYGKCPNCAGEKWTVTDDGTVCAKCGHPHGEPAGDVDEERIKTQRQKTVKTVEALIRAFDDLQMLKSDNAQHATVIETCKVLLHAAKEWK